jgi:S-adenosylmethionine synthetase
MQCSMHAWRRDTHSRVACETYAKSNVVIVGGEITSTAKLDYVQIVRDTVREIGYVNDDDVFHADRIFVSNIITGQSPDIAQGVDARAAEGKDTAEQGAGDQGLMFGYACDETPELMPAPIMFAHRLERELTRIRKSGKVGWLRPDAKSQVSVIYEDGKPIGISCVVVSTQHSRDVKHSEIRSFVIEGSNQESFARGHAQRQNTISGKPDRQFRHRRPAGRHRPDWPQDHC